MRGGSGGWLGGVAARRWSYRRGQGLVLIGLAALVVAACAAGPLYERAVEQATVRSTLAAADRTTRGVQIDTDDFVRADRVTPPSDVSGLFDPPVSGAELDTIARVAGRKDVLTTLVYRDGECRHLTLAAGRCPTARNEVLASAVSAPAAGIRVGQQVRFSFAKGQLTAAVTVVGLYRHYTGDADYWFGTRYSRPTAFVPLEAAAGEPSAPGINAFFGTSELITQTSDRIGILQVGQPARYSVSLALRPDRVGVNELPALRGEVARLSAPEVAGSKSSVVTGLDDYLHDIDTGRHDARRSVLALAVQLALLAVLCFVVVVGAAAEQRRPELALARLRGQGTGETAGVFVKEMAGLVVLAAVPGVLVSWGLTALACRLWLGQGVHPEIVPAVVAAVAGALVVLVAIAAVTGLRVSRQPISDLLREVPPPRVARGLGVLEAMVFVAALAGLAASLNGHNSTLAILTPTFLAVLAGLVLSRVAVLGARLAAAGALARGRLVTALAAVSMARRSGGRFTTTILCVSTALVIFAGQQWSVAAANRSERAEATTGAAVTLDLQTTDLRAVVRAAQRIDPQGDWAAPVAIVRPPGIDAGAVVAVEPGSFAAVSAWGRSALRPATATLRKLDPPRPAPSIAFTGTSLQVTIATSTIRELQPPQGIPVSAILRIGIRHDDGETEFIPLGTLPKAAGAPVTLTGPVACSEGCTVNGIQIARVIPDSTPIQVRFTVAALRSGSTVLHIGSMREWASTTSPIAIAGLADHDTMRAEDTSGGLQFEAVDDGNFDSMQYLDTPLALPALTAGATPNGRDDLGYVTATGLDGMQNRIAVVGSVPFVPAVGGTAVLVDLDVAVATSQALAPVTAPAIWLRTDDPSREAALVAALRQGDVTVTGRHTAAALRHQYENSAPGWSNRFSMVVAAVAELLAVGLLVLVLMTSRRTREQDLASLRLAGIARRRLRWATLIELVVFVVVGVAGGTAAGLVGARLVLHRLPIFAAPPLVPLPTIFPVDRIWLAGGIVLSVLLLLGVAVGLAGLLVRRATPERFAGSGAG